LNLCCAVTRARSGIANFRCLRRRPLESPDIAYRKLGVPLPRSVQFQRSLSLHSAQEARSKARREWTTEAGAPPRDCRDASGSMNASLALPPAWDRRGDEYLRQCLLFFPFSSLNAHYRMVGCSFSWQVAVPGIGDPGIVYSQPGTLPCSAGLVDSRYNAEFRRQERILRQKKSARILTDTAIRRLPDCAIDCRGCILRSWS
jgi:hypothetical protein